MTSWHHHVDWPQLWLTSCVPLWVEVGLKCVFRHTEDYFHYQLIYDKERKVSWLRFFGGDQMFSQLCLCERNSNVRLFSQSVWVKQTRRRTSSWFCHENKCWASLTVCTECNLISSCICIQSLCITHTLWCSAGYRICMKCMMSCGAGSDPLIDPLTGNWVPTAQTWLSLSSPPTSVLVASRRCSNMRGEIWTYSAHTHTHTCGVLTVCCVCLQHWAEV